MTSPIHRIGDLEINQDLSVQERMWTIQRVGWGIMLMVIVLGLTGLFGHGPISRASAGNKHGGLWVEYERFARNQSQSTLLIHLPTMNGSGRASFWLNDAFLASVEIQHMTPVPLATTVMDHGVSYDVGLADNQEPTVIIIPLIHQRSGWLTGELRSPGVGPVTFTQLVYP